MTSTEPTNIVKLSTPADIIGALPAIVGFHPAESLVVVCLHGPRKRQGLTMRLDLPPAGDEANVAAELVERIAAEKPNAIVLVCYTASPDDRGELARTRLVDGIVAGLGEREIGYLELLLVRDGRWWSYTCTKPCCPREGTPVPDVPTGAATEYAALRALSGRVVLPDRDALEKSVRGPVALRRIALDQRYDEAAAVFVAEVQRAGLEQARARTLERASALLTGFESGEPRLGDAEVCRVLIGLTDLAARDALIVWGVDDDREPLIALLTRLAQCALDEDAAPVCTVLAAVAYLDGNGALANVAVERALRSDPGYSMAQLVDSALAGQLDPKHLRRVYGDLKDEFPRPAVAGTDESEAA